MPHRKIQPAPEVTHVAMNGDELVVEFGPDTRLILAPHIVEHAAHRERNFHPYKEYRYVETAKLQDFSHAAAEVFFAAGGRQGQIVHLDRGYSQASLASYWSAAAAYIRDTDFPPAIKQVIAAGDPMLEALAHSRFPAAPTAPRPSRAQRLSRALHLTPARAGAH